MKIILFLFFVFLLSLCAIWFDENSGTVLINWLDYELEFSTTFLFSAFILFSLVAYIAIGLIFGLINLPRSIKKLFGKSEESKIKLLEKSFAALLAADFDTAEKTTQKLLRVTNNDKKFRKLALIAASKTAQERGDYNRAQEQFIALSDNNSLKFFATKGLLQNSFNEGNLEQAINYAEEAYKVNPKVKNGAHSVLDLYKKAGKWHEAERFIKANSNSFWLGKRGGLNQNKELAEVKFLHARELLLTADGRTGFIDLAINNLVEAIKLVPAHEEAVLVLIKLCEDNNRLADAKKAVENFWKYKTNFEIGKKYIDVLTANDSAKKDRAKKAAKKLYKINPYSEASKELLNIYS